MKLALVADDFTGANDTGAKLGKLGIKTLVTTNLHLADELIDYQALVFDSESRFIAQNEAYDRVYKLCRSIRQKSDTPVYKKVDSTFRGNPGPEILGCLDGLNLKTAIVAAALPSQGRVTRQGTVYVNGVRLEETEVRNDPVTPVKDSHIPKILNKDNTKTSCVIDKSSHEESFRDPHKLKKILEQEVQKETTFVVVDGESEEDLIVTAKAIELLDSPVMAAGTAGLAEYFSLLYGWFEKKQHISIIASASQVTRKQVEYAKNTMSLVDAAVYIPDLLSDDGLKMCFSHVEEAKKLNQPVIIRTMSNHDERGSADDYGRKIGLSSLELSNAITRRLGEFFVAYLEKHITDIGSLLLSGGDTVIKMVEAISASGMELKGEVLPGIPYGFFHHKKYDGFPVITKAGGFGSEKDVATVLKLLNMGLLQKV